MEQVVETTQQPAIQAPVAPAESSVETSTQPEHKVGSEGTEQKVETEETPQKRESRRARQLNRERERRIAAETELRLLREQRQQPKDSQTTADPEAPSREQYETYEEFIRAEARHVATKEARDAARKEAENLRKSSDDQRNRESQEKAARAWHSQIEKARDEVDDFDEICAESNAIVTQAMSFAIMDSDKGALIAYHLAKNPAEAERISKLSPSKQAAAIVALEEKVAKSPITPSNAPAPITPVGQKGAEVEKDPAQMTDKEFAAWRKRQIAQRGR